MSATLSLRELLNQHSGPAAHELIERYADGDVRCFACGHRCLVRPGRFGVCRVRFNEGGELRVPRGYVAGIAVDPIEKKPFFHAYPGSEALSFGMLGCDFHCGYCQNWITSQALRDEQAQAPPSYIDAERIVALALDHGCRVLTSTYNEPLITSEWAVEVFKLGKQAGLVGSYVSNGNATPQVLEFIRPYVDLYKVDLKAFRDKTYRELGGVLANTLSTIRLLKQMGFWFEIVTLVVPGLNDSDQELREIAEFIAGVAPEIPWHVTAFHPDYRMTDPPRTTVDTLLRAHELGRQAGLRFVYAGNLPGLVGDRENTRCHNCGERVLRRRGFEVLENRLIALDETGPRAHCPACEALLPGVWPGVKDDRAAGAGMPRRVSLRTL